MYNLNHDKVIRRFKGTFAQKYESKVVIFPPSIVDGKSGGVL